MLRSTAKAAVAETTAVTEAWRSSARTRLRDRLRGIHLGRPTPSQLVLPFAAFVLGLAASAAGFVGLWQHTASRRDEAKIAQAAAEKRLSHIRLQVAHLQAKLTRERALLARARTKQAALRQREASLSAQLDSARGTNRAIATRLPGQLAAIAEAAAALARQSSAVASELTGLQAYVASSGSALDAGYLKTQVRYVIGTSQTTQAEASRLQSDIAAAADTIAVLRSTR